MQKYMHIIESCNWILEKFVVTLQLPMNFLTFFGIYSTPKLSMHGATSFLT